MLYQPKTQKAKGVYLLQGLSHVHWDALDTAPLSGLPPLTVLGVFPANEPIPDDFKSLIQSTMAAGQLFVRPCPPSPEHGFVESRIVKTFEELEALRLETLAANEDSEILLTQKIDCELNAVWTPHALAIGPGHDGATAGKKCMTIPLAGRSKFTDAQLKKAGIKEGDGPFVELVKSKNGHNWYTTQLRGGPAEPAPLDFLPGTRTCEKIVKTKGEDLLEWAAIVKELKKDPGLFVWHPGGSVVDHYSVHCRCNGVPIFTTQKPEIGVTYDAMEVIPHSAHEMARGIAAGEMVCNEVAHGDQIYLTLLALHNSDALRGPAAFWIGVGAAVMCKLGLGALEAEGRHAHSCYQGMKGKPDIYGFYNSKSLSFARARLSRITQLLTYGWGDPEKHGGGYGGPKWGMCGAAMTPVFDAMRKIILFEKDEDCAELIGALNIAINQAHNGGWWLNKFADVAAYDEIPKGKIYFLLRAADTAYYIHTKMDPKAINTRLVRMKKQAAYWPEQTKIAPLKWRKVTLDIGPGEFILNLKASTVPTPRSFTIPLNPALKTQLLKSLGEIKIAPGTIDLVMKGGESLNVWTEKPLAVEPRFKQPGGHWVAKKQA